MKTTKHFLDKGFTLIELLIVMAIIGILMALLFPAVNGVILAAKRATAKNDATQIATACVAYETEYGVSPFGSNSYSEVKGNLLKSLMGDNPRKITFIEVQNFKEKMKGGYDGTSYLDPWGGPYQIISDPSYSSSITNAGTNGKTEVRRNYAVWTDPTKQAWKTNSKPSRRYVESWE